MVSLTVVIVIVLLFNPLKEDLILLIVAVELSFAFTLKFLSSTFRACTFWIIFSASSGLAVKIASCSSGVILFQRLITAVALSCPVRVEYLSIADKAFHKFTTTVALSLPVRVVFLSFASSLSQSSTIGVALSSPINSTTFSSASSSLISSFILSSSDVSTSISASTFGSGSEYVWINSSTDMLASSAALATAA